MKRKKTVKAGRVVWSYIYTIPKPRDTDKVRADKLLCSSKARRKMNQYKATIELERRIEANFSHKDFKMELTYSNEFLPTYNESKEIMRKFIIKLRNLRKLRGVSLKYIYVTEHKHARLHHHIVMNGTSKQDLEEIQSIWNYGEIIEIDYLWDTGHYFELAAYLTKESKDDKDLYTRRWNASLNLIKPQIENRQASADESIEVPIGAEILESDSYRNEFGEFKYIKYILPITQKVKPTRKKIE